MNPADFEFLSQFLKKRSGLALTADKDYLITSRLNPIAEKKSLAGVADVIVRLRAGDEALARLVVEAMTTNESFFFRDKVPFDQFSASVLPALIRARSDKRRLSIWCAAASSGQEPYSLAMLLRDNATQLKDWSVQILATDISSEILTRAQTGVYSQFEVQRGLPIQMLVKYFTKVGEQWRIKDEIRNMVQFRCFNLLDPYLGLGPFDVIFCRNVLIYFEEPTKKAVLERLAQSMSMDGYLALGAAESVFGVTSAFAPVDGMRGLYQRRSEVKLSPALSRATG
jgi:chemotaxis protein methyltransferase CheR